MSNSKLSPWIMWFLAAIFYAYQYILRVMPNIILEDIMLKFNVDAASFGQFSGIYYIGYSLLHLPIGMMLDRFGPRRVMSVCILISVVGTLPLILADVWVYPVIGRFLLGAGSSAAILGAFKIIRMMFDEGRFTRMLSLAVSIGLIGAIYGGGPVSYMCQNLGYVAVVKIFALIGIILAVLTYLIVPEIESTNNGTVFSDIREVLSNSRVIFTCIFAGMMVGPIEGFADVWGSVFFKRIYGFDHNLAASLPSTIFIGMCFGAPLLSLIAEKTNNYLGTIIFAGTSMSIVFLSLIFLKLTVGVISFSFIIVGICCAYQIIAIYQASTYVHERVAGLTNALANMIIMSFGYAFHSIIGAVITNMGGIESPEAFVYGIAVIPVCLIIGSIGFMLIAVSSPSITSFSETK